MCSKISKTSGAIYRARYYLTSEAKLAIYYSLVYPYLTYCNVIWSSAYPTTLNRLFLLQKSVLRSTVNAEFHVYNALLFRKLKILDIHSINALNIAQFMFHYHNNTLPTHFFSMFQTNSDVHAYSTRTSNHYRTHTEKEKESLTPVGIEPTTCLYPLTLASEFASGTQGNNFVTFLHK